jgi:hypothetical protein
MTIDSETSMVGLETFDVVSPNITPVSGLRSALVENVLNLSNIEGVFGKHVTSANAPFGVAVGTEMVPKPAFSLPMYPLPTSGSSPATGSVGCGGGASSQDQELVCTPKSYRGIAPGGGSVVTAIHVGDFFSGGSVFTYTSTVSWTNDGVPMTGRPVNDAGWDVAILRVQGTTIDGSAFDETYEILPSDCLSYIVFAQHGPGAMGFVTPLVFTSITFSLTTFSSFRAHTTGGTGNQPVHWLRMRWTSVSRILGALGAVRRTAPAVVFRSQTAGASAVGSLQPNVDEEGSDDHGDRSPSPHGSASAASGSTASRDRGR